MEYEVVVLNVLDYNDKRTNEPKSRIGYIYKNKEYCSNNSKFIGRSEMALYVNGSYRDKFNVDDITTKSYCLVVGEEPNAKNPMRKRIVPLQLKVDNKVIIDFN